MVFACLGLRAKKSGECGDCRRMYRWFLHVWGCGPKKVGNVGTAGECIDGFCMFGVAGQKKWGMWGLQENV